MPIGRSADYGRPEPIKGEKFNTLLKAYNEKIRTIRAMYWRLLDEDC